MAAKLPYLVVYGRLDKMLEKVLAAQTPSRFTQDFLSTKLGFKGGNYRSLIPLLKKMGFLGSDGAPTERYKRFRNTEISGIALAEGIKQAYAELYSRNEFTHDLTEEQLTGLVVETTGGKADSPSTKNTVRTFAALKALADFDGSGGVEQQETEKTPPAENRDLQVRTPQPPSIANDAVGVSLSYTINLNLPETTNVDVFDAIFKSLKDNLLRQ